MNDFEKLSSEEEIEASETAEPVVSAEPEEMSSEEKPEENPGAIPIITSDGGEITDVKKRQTRVLTVYEYVETFCYALALMMVLFLFVFRYVAVEGDSMRDTLHNDDKLIISNMFYSPKTGDIVVINPESHGESNSPIIKRVIATEGQSVYIDYKNWEVYVDGEKLDEPYIESMKNEMEFLYGDDVEMRNADNMKYNEEFVVGKDKVFVMGDNRNNSKDSRAHEYGEMDENRIIGRVILRLFPKFGRVN